MTLNWRVPAAALLTTAALGAADAAGRQKKTPDIYFAATAHAVAA